MKPEAYRRNLTARAFDIARYLLPFGIPTGVGQVTSIRTLEKQVRRLKASEFQELREVGDELARACAEEPQCVWGSDPPVPVAPTLARHAEADSYTPRLRANLAEWAADHLPPEAGLPVKPADLLQPADALADICATLLYPVVTRSYRELYDLACHWSQARRQEVIHIALGSRSRRDELPRHFRSAPYVFDFVMDIGAYRDLHRHRRCQQFRQYYTSNLGFETPEAIAKCQAADVYADALAHAAQAMKTLPPPASQYVLPFAARSRFLFKMDFAELEYIARLRSGVKGHFSYRSIAWAMKQELERLDPFLGTLVEATPPWVEDPLTR
jgi:thymidylate synthase ThyX